MRAAKPPAATPATESGAYDRGKSAFESKQYNQARMLFNQACDSGEMKACNYLGYLYAQGLGVPPDAETARKIYQKACEQGNLSSCASLGTMYQDDRKYTEARTYFKQACDGEIYDACNYLGYLYDQGLGGPPDKQMARQIYQKACDGKVTEACERLRYLQ
jgi:TPR repeat protein